MSKKQIIVYALVIAALGALVYFQVQHWKKFDWAKFSQQTSAVNWWIVISGALLIYAADSLRAWRWAIFLRPIKKVSGVRLLPAQFIGFAGLALLGRPGEFVRPYIIARKENLTFSSQVAVWTVERIFDTTAVAILISFDLLFSASLRTLDHPEQLKKFGFALIAIVVFGIGLVFFLWRFAIRIAAWIKKTFEPRFPHGSNTAANKVLAFGEGLNTIHGVPSFIALSIISLAIWIMVAFAYLQVVHAYPDPELNTLAFSDVVMLMGFSIAGGVLQLPVVGGGSQLLTIGALTYFFEVPQELAVSGGILLWLVTFMSVIPLGLALAHREHVSLRELSVESREESEDKIANLKL